VSGGVRTGSDRELPSVAADLERCGVSITEKEAHLIAASAGALASARDLLARFDFGEHPCEVAVDYGAPPSSWLPA
jgi:hypothetical protein